MATKRSQKIFIWVIAVTMLVGSVGAYFLMILANDNAARDATVAQEQMEQFEREYAEYQEKVQEQGDQLSEKYYDEFKKYEKDVGSFSSDVDELKKRDLKKGDGEALTKESEFTAYYIGWNPEGKIFDSSFGDDVLKPPFKVTPGSVIAGWTEGVDGMKVGGVRELTLPAELAYGASGSGEMIPPNTPLRFIIMVIPTPEEIPQPEVSDELMRYYNSGF